MSAIFDLTALNSIAQMCFSLKSESDSRYRHSRIDPFLLVERGAFQHEYSED
jgi:hypothetical protein